MDFWNLASIFIFLSQTTTGILGNVSQIFYYIVLICKGCTIKPTDLILMHLTGANVLTVLSVGVPQTMAVWGFKHFLNDFGCKLLLYIQGLGRSVSIVTTCFLSVLRALTISPRKSCWKKHKVKVEKNICCHLFLLWILYMIISFIYFAYTLFNRNSNNMTRKWDFEYCYFEVDRVIGDSLYTALVVCPEVLFSILIVWSSGFFIVILYRHKQMAQHIHSTHGSNKNSPESRITQNILILLSTFLAFYTLSSILRGYIAFLNSHNWWLPTFNRFISLCFPSFGPFVLINHYSVASRLFGLHK